jgi:hypothetical protein
MAGAHLDDEEHLQAAQGNSAAGVEEVTRQHRRSLSMRELPPGRVAALRRWQVSAGAGVPAAPSRLRRGYPGRATRPGSAGSPRPGFPAPSARPAPRAWHRQADGHCGEDRSSASGSAAGARPAPCPVSPAGEPQRPGEQAGQSREQRPAGPAQLGLGVLPPQHCDLLARHQQLRILRRRRTSQQHYPPARRTKMRQCIPTVTSPRCCQPRSQRRTQNCSSAT